MLSQFGSFWRQIGRIFPIFRLFTVFLFLLSPLPVSAQLFEDEEIGAPSEEEFEEEGALLGFNGDIPPSIRRDSEAGERFLDEAEDDIDEEFEDGDEEE
jgi:hypothetical protein